MGLMYGMNSKYSALRRYEVFPLAHPAMSVRSLRRQIPQPRSAIPEW